jgi:hypothetical protein
MKAILIDTTNQTISEVDIKGDLTSWYEAINCDIVEIAVRLDNGDIILVDEEGLWKSPSKFFTYNHAEYTNYPFAGKGLVIGSNGEDTSDAKSTVQEIADKVKFQDKQSIIRRIYQPEFPN